MTGLPAKPTYTGPMQGPTPEDAARELLRRSGARASLAQYAAYIDPTHAPAAHHRLLIGALEAVASGDCTRLLVLMPPGSGKSWYAAVRFPEWIMGRRPDTDIIAASHTAELAERFGRRVRNTLGSPEYRHLFGDLLAEDNQAAGRWSTRAGGEYYATGVGGSITGRRALIGIIDDPVRGREDADSERHRETAWQWYTNDFLTRLKPNARQIIIQTRWHEDDLSGRILARERERWHVLCLPMIAVPGDPLGRAVGERLWPEWFTDDMVYQAKLDTRAWNALYQQEPAPDAGDFFQRGWFTDYDIPPVRLHVYGASDYAVTEGAGDYTEHGIFGVDWQGTLYVLDWWRGQAGPEEWIERQCDLIDAHRPFCWFGEGGMIRRALEPSLRRRMSERRSYCRLEWLPSIADKPTRARSIQSRASMGKLRFPATAAWKSDVLGQLLRFPAGRHDDAVDVCSLIGRGLDQVSEAPKGDSAIKPAVDRWERAFARHEDSEGAWKTV